MSIPLRRNLGPALNRDLVWGTIPSAQDAHVEGLVFEVDDPGLEVATNQWQDELLGHDAFIHRLQDVRVPGVAFARLEDRRRSFWVCCFVERPEFASTVRSHVCSINFGLGQFGVRQ